MSLARPAIFSLCTLTALVVGCAGPSNSPTGSRKQDTAKVDSVADAGPSPTTQSCDDAYARLDDLRQLALAHAKGCTQDSDCTLVDSSIPCQDDCLAAVLVSEKASFEGALSTYAAEECPAVQNGNGSTCRVSPSCAALSGADCINGTCYPVVAGAGAPPPSEPPADAGSDVPGTPDAG